MPLERQGAGGDARRAAGGARSGEVVSFVLALVLVAPVIARAQATDLPGLDATDSRTPDATDSPTPDVADSRSRDASDAPTPDGADSRALDVADSRTPDATGVVPLGATSLRVDAPPGCSSSEAVEAEIRRLVGRAGDLVVPGARAVSVTIAAVETGYRLELRSEATDGSDAGTRVLADPSCSALAEAAALIVAMMIDPDATLLSAASPPPPPPLAASALSSTRASVSEGSPLAIERARDLAAPTPPPPVDPGLPPLALGAAGAVDIGLLPTAMGGVVAEVLVRIDSIDLRGRITYLFPSPTQRTANGGADVSAVLGAIAGCVRPVPEVWFGVCLGLEGGALFAQPVGVAIPAPGTPAGGLLAAVGGLTLAWPPFDVFDIEIAVEFVVSLYRPRFEIAGPDDTTGPPLLVHEPGAAGPRFRLAFHFDIRP